MGAIFADKDGVVTIRGVGFPVQVIYDAMADTGGTLVVDPDTLSRLDQAMAVYTADKGPDVETPQALLVEAYPTYWFVPRRIKLHYGMPGMPKFDLEGVKSDSFLYFAVPRVF